MHKLDLDTKSARDTRAYLAIFRDLLLFSRVVKFPFNFIKKQADQGK